MRRREGKDEAEAGEGIFSSFVDVQRKTLFCFVKSVSVLRAQGSVRLLSENKGAPVLFALPLYVLKVVCLVGFAIGLGKLKTQGRNKISGQMMR